MIDEIFSIGYKTDTFEYTVPRVVEEVNFEMRVYNDYYKEKNKKIATAMEKGMERMDKLIKQQAENNGEKSRLTPEDLIGNFQPIKYSRGKWPPAFPVSNETDGVNRPHFHQAILVNDNMAAMPTKSTSFPMVASPTNSG